MEGWVILGLGIATALDWRYRKVPNWLTLAMALCGIIFQSLGGGLPAFKESVLGLLLGIALLYIPFQLGGMGGGDVKLLGALGAFAGPMGIIKIFLASAVFGGIFSLAVVAKEKAWRSSLEAVKQRMLYLLLTKRLARESEIAFSPHPIRIPYALTISCGYLWMFLFGGG